MTCVESVVHEANSTSPPGDARVSRAPCWEWPGAPGPPPAAACGSPTYHYTKTHDTDPLTVYTRFAQEFTNPRNGPMNLATYLPNHFVPPDLGPKSYIAYGSKTENPPHDSVTRMHEDLCDAVNVLLYAARVETNQAPADDDQCAPALASPSSASVNNEHDRTFADSIHASLDVPRDSLSGRPRQIAGHIATLPICCTETRATAIETR